MGSAGTILALLALAELYDDPALFEDAREIGDELIDRARVTEHGWSWADPLRRRRGHLCGLSHGSAGIGWALLELFATTGDARFRTAAEGAFASERSWFDAHSGAGPDLRAGVRRRGAARRFPSPAAGTWCHGGAGIALTRLRASAVLGPAIYQDEAELALEATRRELLRAELQERDDLTLCHGAAGAADALLCGEAALAEGRPVAVALGVAAIERYGAVPGEWPCGAAGGTNPSLFRGLGGIAWWLLRLHDPAIPSPLMLPASAVDTPARVGVGSSGRPPTLATEEVYACPRSRVSIHSSGDLRAHSPHPPRSRAFHAAPGVPELVTLVGYISGTVAHPATNSDWLLVYRDWRMITWYLIEGTGIIHLDTVPDDGEPTRARDLLYVDRDTAVGRGSGPQSDEARFLTGDFTRAGDLDPWEDSGPTGTGLTTPYGNCGPRSRR